MSDRPRYADQRRLYDTPVSNDNSAVSFWSQPIKARLSRSTLTPSQTAKRDLDRYHDLIADALPPITEQAAKHLIGYLRDVPSILHWTTLSKAEWTHLADTLRCCPELHRLDPLQRMALLDAADRCIRHLLDHPQEDLVACLPDYFRLTPTES